MAPTRRASPAESHKTTPRMSPPCSSAAASTPSSASISTKLVWTMPCARRGIACHPPAAGRVIGNGATSYAEPMAVWCDGKPPSLPYEKGRSRKRSGGDPRLILARLTQHIAAAPHGLDVVLAVRSAGELLAQLADEDVDDLDLGLVHPAVEIVEKHLLGVVVPLRRLRSYSIWYSLPVRCTRAPPTSTGLVSRLTMRSPVRPTDWACPFERRTMAWMRATSPSLWNG